jgi:hypothetical protein
VPICAKTDSGTRTVEALLVGNRHETLDLVRGLLTAIAAGDGMDDGTELVVNPAQPEPEIILRNTLSVLAELKVGVKRTLRDHAQTRQKKDRARA